MDNKIIIFDTTLRDGEQTPGVNLNLSEKIQIARQLEKLGVNVIEAGFPAASPGDFECVSGIAAAMKTTTVAALARCVKGDIDKAAEAVKNAVHPRIHVFLATSPIHMQYKLKMDPETVIEKAVEAVSYAKQFCEDIQFSCEDATRSEPEFMYRVLEAVIDAGATTVNIPDTVGYAMPEEYGRLIAGIVKNVKNIDKAIIATHCHNDLGMAVANSIAGVSNGVRQVECTINGLGERAGNTAMEEVIMGLKTRADYFGEFETTIDTKQIARTSRLVSTITGVSVQVNKAIVGKNAFAHESGIHQDGMLKNRATYEIMTPESIGIEGTSLVLGKHSGRHAFNDRLIQMGYNLSPEELNDAFARFKDLADRKKNIEDRDIEKLIGHEMTISDVPKAYKLESFQLQTGNTIKSMAAVQLQHNDTSVMEAAIGDGPIFSAFNAIERIVGGEWPLQDYNIKAVTEGEDALGEVTVRVGCGEESYTGKGLSPDIIEASIRAYLNAINRAIADAEKKANQTAR